MAATGLNLNWSSVMIGPTALTKVTSMDFNPGGTLIKFKGDADLYPVVIACADIEPTVSVTSGDIGTLYGFSPTANPVTITATLLDAKQASGGAINFTAVNCQFRTQTMNAPHAQFASGTGSWDLFSSDGVTPPITFTRS